MPENTQQTEPGLFDEFQQPIRATRWQRFFNYVIDNIFMNYGLSFLTSAVVIALFPEQSTVLTEGFGPDPNSITPEELYAAILPGLVLGIINYLLYYTICEQAFKGYTLGKLITGTRAIRNDGKDLTFRDALLRSLSRLVPFEVLSGFGTPWHDDWTKTQVIKTR
jgi:uncharacterized RDD family membrane protein YckC